MTKITASTKLLNDPAILELPGKINKALRDGLREAGKIVIKEAKGLVPPPGYPGDKPGLKPLRDTLGVEIREGTVVFAVVGPKAPAGAHGHLVEYGHRIQGGNEYTEAKPFMEPAAKQTLERQGTVIARTVKTVTDLANRG